MTPPRPDGYALFPLHKGDTYARTVEGGVRRARAADDGVLVSLDDRNVFIPLADVLAVVARLAPRAAPRRATLPFGKVPGDDPADR